MINNKSGKIINITSMSEIKDRTCIDLKVEFNNEEDFKKIQSEMVKITEKKKSFEKDNIKTTNIGEEQFVTYEAADKTTFLDNTHTKDNMTIERQLEELQPTQRDFQTTDQKQNTDRMMQELQDSKKELLISLTRFDQNHIFTSFLYLTYIL